MSFLGKTAKTDYGAIEAKRKQEAEAAERLAKETAFADELEKMKTQRGRAATILSAPATGRGTFA